MKKPDLTDPENPVMKVEDGRIDFNHVNFSYKHGSGKNALSDIDLHIKSGETVGVIGGTGSREKQPCQSDLPALRRG